jgi:hypothetical protein
MYQVSIELINTLLTLVLQLKKIPFGIEFINNVKYFEEGARVMDMMLVGGTILR